LHHNITPAAQALVCIIGPGRRPPRARGLARQIGLGHVLNTPTAVVSEDSSSYLPRRTSSDAAPRKCRCDPGLEPTKGACGKPRGRPRRSPCRAPTAPKDRRDGKHEHRHQTRWACEHSGSWLCPVCARL